MPPKGAAAAPVALDVSTLSEGASVNGYVTAVTSSGVFIALDGATVGRVKLNNLSDGFIEDPKAAFPEGRRVTARVLSVAPGRFELSLRSAGGAGGSGWRKLSDLKEVRSRMCMSFCGKLCSTA